MPTQAATLPSAWRRLLGDTQGATALFAVTPVQLTRTGEQGLFVLEIVKRPLDLNVLKDNRSLTYVNDLSFKNWKKTPR